MGLRVDDPIEIINWRRIDERVTSSGQPTEEQLRAIGALGVTHVVNLGLHSHQMALPDEAASVEALGMSYVHIPVQFNQPTEEDFARFCEVIAELKGHTVHVHCIMNWRVSAFFYRYRRDVLGLAEAASRAAMEDVWQPNQVWTEFVDG